MGFKTLQCGVVKKIIDIGTQWNTHRGVLGGREGGVQGEVPVSSAKPL